VFLRLFGDSQPRLPRQGPLPVCISGEQLFTLRCSISTLTMLQFCLYRWFFFRTQPKRDTTPFPSLPPPPVQPRAATPPPSTVTVFTPSGQFTDIVASSLLTHSSEAALKKYGVNYHPLCELEFASRRRSLVAPRDPDDTKTRSLASSAPIRTLDTSGLPAPIASGSRASRPISASPVASAMRRAGPTHKSRKRARFASPSAVRVASPPIASEASGKRKGWTGWVEVPETELAPSDKLVAAVTVFETRRTRSGRQRP
jgi:hypothetical protein